MPHQSLQVQCRLIIDAQLPVSLVLLGAVSPGGSQNRTLWMLPDWTFLLWSGVNFICLGAQELACHSWLVIWCIVLVHHGWASFLTSYQHILPRICTSKVSEFTIFRLTNLRLQFPMQKYGGKKGPSTSGSKDWGADAKSMCRSSARRRIIRWSCWHGGFISTTYWQWMYKLVTLSLVGDTLFCVVDQ